jgi:TolB protein
MLRLLLLPTTITLLLAGLIGAAIAAGRALDASTILAYVSYVGGDQEIHIMDLHRAVSINVTRSPEQDSTPAWSPDGRRIAFVSQRDRNYEIYMLDLTTGRSVNLSNSRDTVDREAAWSAGGTLVAFTTLVASGRDVSIVDLATGDKRVLLPDSDMADAMPQWSPDGRHIAFQTYERGQWRVEIMDFETGDIWRVSEDAVPGQRTAWSPDGTLLAFVGAVGADASSIFIADVAAQTVQRMTFFSQNDHDPAWSPDGTRIVFTASPFIGQEDISVLTVDGTDPVQRLTDEPGVDSAPSWSPDGEWIAFYSDRGDTPATRGIYLIRPDGSDLHKLNPFLDFMPTWRP